MPLDRKRLLGCVETIQLTLGVTDKYHTRAVCLGWRMGGGRRERVAVGVGVSDWGTVLTIHFCHIFSQHLDGKFYLDPSLRKQRTRAYGTKLT